MKRQPPAGIPQPPLAFEYCCYGRIPTPAKYMDNDIAQFGSETWWDTCGWSGTNDDYHYAIRVGTELHRLNFPVEEKPRFVIGYIQDPEDRAVKCYTINDTKPENASNFWSSRVKIFSETPALRDHIIALLNANPLPDPEPTFDWDSLWAELPSWIKWVAMDATKDWYGFDAPPRQDHSQWTRSNNTYPNFIPARHAPAVATDWKLSLVERPQKPS